MGIAWKAFHLSRCCACSLVVYKLKWAHGPAWLHKHNGDHDTSSTLPIPPRTWAWCEEGVQNTGL